MTTEIAILNKSAVALATDSAVTVSFSKQDGAVGQKVYANANKLFELVKGLPVGVMIYNSAEVAGIPWETLVKSYRLSERAVAKPHLKDYALDFLCYVEETLSKDLTSDDVTSSFTERTASIANAILAQIKEDVSGIANKIERRKYVGKIVDQVTRETESTPTAAWAKTIDGKMVFSQIKELVNQKIPTTYCDTHLPSYIARGLAAVSFSLLLRNDSPPPGPWSGVVIAGFGADELLPSMFDATIGGMAGTHLIQVRNRGQYISDGTPSIIEPFAQIGEATMFLQGIDPEILGGISEFWKQWVRVLRGGVVDVVRERSDASSEVLQVISEDLSKIVSRSWREFAEYMKNEFHVPRMGPIAASASFLSKGEIADLAENLVELTSLRNRVSLDRQETVGGATDVAVISKGDGFVWVNRKHYFDQKRNPTWAIRQGLRDVQLDAGRGRRSTEES